MKKRTLMILLAGLMLAAFASPDALACDPNFCGAGEDMVFTRPVHVSALVAGALHGTVNAAALAVKECARVVSDLPEHARAQIAANRLHFETSVRNVAHKTENVVHRISAEVTTLSLQLLRSALSSFWALISGLLLS